MAHNFKLEDFDLWHEYYQSAAAPSQFTASAPLDPALLASGNGNNNHSSFSQPHSTRGPHIHNYGSGSPNFGGSNFSGSSYSSSNHGSGFAQGPPYNPMVPVHYPRHAFTPGFVTGPSVSSSSTNDYSSHSGHSVANGGMNFDEGGTSCNGFSSGESQSDGLFVRDRSSPATNFHRGFSGPLTQHQGSQFVAVRQGDIHTNAQEHEPPPVPASRKRPANNTVTSNEQTGRRRKRRQAPEQDDENVQIMQLRTKHYMEWAGIAEELNRRRQEQGHEAHHTVASVYGRFVRNASRVSKALGEGPINTKDWMHINSEAQRQRPGVGVIAPQAVVIRNHTPAATSVTTVVDEFDIVLSETAHEVFKHCQVWKEVANELLLRTGREYDSERLRKKYENFHFSVKH